MVAGSPHPLPWILTVILSCSNPPHPYPHPVFCSDISQSTLRLPAFAPIIMTYNGWLLPFNLIHKRIKEISFYLIQSDYAWGTKENKMTFTAVDIETSLILTAYRTCQIIPNAIQNSWLRNYEFCIQGLHSQNTNYYLKEYIPFTVLSHSAAANGF